MKFRALVAASSILILVAAGSAIDINDSDSLEYWSDSTRDFRVQTSGNVDVYGNLSLGTSQEIQSYFQSSDCGSGEVVDGINPDGTYSCVSVSGEVSDQDLESVLNNGNYTGSNGIFFNGSNPLIGVGSGDTNITSTGRVEAGADIDTNGADLDGVANIYTDSGSTSFFSGGASSSETVTGITTSGNLQTTSILAGNSNIAFDAVNQSQLAQGNCGTDEVLKWDGSSWICQSASNLGSDSQDLQYSAGSLPTSSSTSQEIGITGGANITFSDAYEPDDQSLSGGDTYNNDTISLDNGGSVTVWDRYKDGDTDSTNERQGISASDDTITIYQTTSEGTSVDSATITDNTGTDDQNLQYSGSVSGALSQTQTIGIENGNDINYNDAYNPNQTLSTTADTTGTDDTITLDGGNSIEIDDDYAADNQAISGDQAYINDTISLDNGGTATIYDRYKDGDTDSTNERQGISASDDTITIYQTTSEGTSVDSATITDNTGTDDQNLQSTTRSGDTVTIPIENGGSTSFTDNTGTDDQTLSEVLTAGNTANQSIDMNNNSLDNVSTIDGGGDLVEVKDDLDAGQATFGGYGFSKDEFQAGGLDVGSNMNFPTSYSGYNVRYNGSQFIVKGDGGSNAGTIMYSPIGTKGLRIARIPSTGGSEKSLTPSEVSNEDDLVIQDGEVKVDGQLTVVGGTECADNEFIDGLGECETASGGTTENLADTLTAGNYADGQNINVNGSAKILFPDGVKIGNTNTYTMQVEDTAVGRGANASADQTYNAATAVGDGADAIDRAAVALGQSSTAEDRFATAIGADTVSDKEGTAVGYHSDASGFARTTAIGAYAEATSSNALALGYTSLASGNGAIAIGRSADATANDGIAIGNYANAPNQFEATFGNLGNEQYDINVTGNATVHGSGGIDLEKGDIRIEDSGSANAGTIDELSDDSLAINSNGNRLRLQSSSSNAVRAESDLQVYQSNITAPTRGNVTVGDSLKVYGNVWTSGADVAEIYRTDGEAEQGDIVAISDERDNAVERTSSRYEETSIGVISTDPGYVMNKGETGKPVALTGKVPVKVSTENGDIERGDRIVPSGEPGKGMKCETWDPAEHEETPVRKVLSHNQDCRDSTIGRALEESSEDGKILVKLEN